MLFGLNNTLILWHHRSTVVLPDVESNALGKSPTHQMAWNFT